MTDPNKPAIEEHGNDLATHKPVSFTFTLLPNVLNDEQSAELTKACGTATNQRELAAMLAKIFPGVLALIP